VLVGLLGGLLRPLLKLLDGLGGAVEGLGAVSLDGLLAVGGELGLPVALALLMLGEQVLLVALVVRVVCGKGGGQRGAVV